MTADQCADVSLTITLRPIGTIHTDLRLPDATSTPRLTPDELRARMAARPPSAERGRVEVFEEFALGLTDLEETVEGVGMYDGTPLLDIKPVGRSGHAAGPGES